MDWRKKIVCVLGFATVVLTAFFVRLFPPFAEGIPPSPKQREWLPAPPVSALKSEIRFEANVGQFDPEVRFVSRGLAYNLFLTSNGALFLLPEKQDTLSHLRFKLLNSNPGAFFGRNELACQSNYFIGQQREDWITGVPNYASVVQKNVYPGIDLIYYGRNGQLEFDFVVAGGGRPGDIRFKFDGAGRLALAANGDLIVQTPAAELRQHAPHIYQEIAGILHPVAGGFVLAEDMSVQFEVGTYDATYPLVIDPVLSYSTYLGGSDSDFAKGIAVDSAGYLYVTGTILSPDFPVSDSYQPQHAGDFDVFIMKLEPATNTVIYSTFIGGAGGDSGNDIAVDRFGNVHITGNTNSVDFPVVNAVQPKYAGGPFDAFVAMLDPAGDSLVYSTYLGGDKDDIAHAIALDVKGRVYVAGTTGSIDFARVNPIQPLYGGGLSDAFLTRFASGGSAIEYSTFVGSSGSDTGADLTLDSSGNVYLTGTNSDGQFGGLDLYLVKVDTAGTAFIYATQSGTGSNDFGNGVAVDPSGNAYVTGTTIVGPMGGDDAFVIKFDASGEEILYAKFIGGSGAEVGNKIAVDKDGQATVVGRTGSDDFPLVNALQVTRGGGFDAFVAKLDVAGSSFLFSTYLGGSGGNALAGTGDNPRAVVMDGDGVIFIAGHTLSEDFPLQNPLQESYAGGDTDGFIVIVGKQTTSVRETGGPPVSDFILEQNYPNPFNPATTIRFTLTKPGHVRLRVFNTVGRLVSTLVDEVRHVGPHAIDFRADNLASGVYFYRLETGGAVQQQRMLLLR
ncbi:MAG: SBBP repeat-containing protein [Calditrichaeota bacterium]|nr:SBBP repeat-containing protein [Calditrichota bacterium]